MQRQVKGVYEKRRGFVPLSMVTLALAGACAAPEAGAEDDEMEPIARIEGELVGGTATNARPEIGTLGFCTATLVDPRYILTASHCFSFVSGPRSDQFAIGGTVSTCGSSPCFAVDRAYALGAGGGAQDIAFARLTSAVPAATAVPAVIGVAPSAGEQVAVFGYGCTNRSTGAGFPVLTKQFVDYLFADTAVSCPGDSGGPRVHGTHNGNGAIWGIDSGHDWRGVDVNADATQFGPPVLRAVRAFGDTAVTNTGVTDFPSWATAPGARAVAGDFNGDGIGDIALTGGSGWATIPVAFGDGAGGFTVTNRTVTSFPAWAQSATNVVAADFDGDGDTDIALVGGPGWASIPIAFSGRTGAFTVTNFETANIPGWAQASHAVAGDFNGDGVGDIALVGGSGWATIPVAFSTGRGAFSQTNARVTDFPGWAQNLGARPVVGDFDGDGVDDIALSGGSGWATIPVAFSDWHGGFRVTNSGVSDFPAWAQESGVKLVAGDFDGDGDADIAAVGGSGWRSIAFALSSRTGGFTSANFPMADFPTWGNGARFVLATRADAGATTDLVLAGGGGWATMPVAFLRR